MYLIANYQFGLSDGIVYCSELGDSWRLWRTGGCSMFSAGNYILVIASRRSTSKGSPPPCPLSIAEALVLLLNEWMRCCNGQRRKKDPAKSQIGLFFLSRDVRPRFSPKSSEGAHVCQRRFTGEKKPRSDWLVSGLLLAPFVGVKLWSCREKQHTASALKKRPVEGARCCTLVSSAKMAKWH